MEADKIDPYHLYLEEEMCKCMILQFITNITFSNRTNIFVTLYSWLSIYYDYITASTREIIDDRTVYCGYSGSTNGTERRY